MRIARALLAPVAIGAALAAQADPAAIDGHEEAWWRAAITSRESRVASSEEAVSDCEEREAPPAYDGVDGFVKQRPNGRLQVVEIRRCDDERRALEAARTDLDRFEDGARRAGVPPGWLR
jgi:hypothetical protein